MVVCIIVNCCQDPDWGSNWIIIIILLYIVYIFYIIKSWYYSFLPLFIVIIIITVVTVTINQLHFIQHYYAVDRRTLTRLARESFPSCKAAATIRMFVGRPVIADAPPNLLPLSLVE